VFTVANEGREHLRRRHARPISCPRCHKAFANEGLKEEHISVKDICDLREPDRDCERYDSKQADKIHSRGKKKGVTTAADRWNEIYVILFSDTDPAAIPSPCKLSCPLFRLS
jgi:hypothetical protein